MWSRCATSIHGRTPLVLRPGSVAEVAAIVKLANETGTAIVPQGGNTGLVGGQTPLNDEIVLSLNRLDRIREVDATSNTITCEAGVTLQRAREAAAAVDRLYPQLLPSEGTCTIGGNLSTNAGGTAALAYGIARSHVLGIEVVLADGRILQRPQQAEKRQYRLRSEKPVHRRRGHARRDHRRGAAAGSAPALDRDRFRRRCPRPRRRWRCSTSRPSNAGGGVTSFELMPREGIEIVLRYTAGCRDPLADAASLVRADRIVLAGAKRAARRAGRHPRRGRRAAGSSPTPPLPRAWNRPKRSGASARISARRSAMPAARSSTTSRCRSPPCRPFIKDATRRRSSASFPARVPCPSAISATATSTTTSTSRPAPTRPNS